MRTKVPTRTALLLAAGAALLLVGCGEDKQSQDRGVTSTTGSTATTTTSPSTSATTAPTTTTASPATSAAAKIAIPDVVGKDLQFAQDTLQAAGFYHLTSHDSTGQNRLQVLDRNWRVTDQTPAAGTRVSADQLIDLGARKFTD